MSLLEVLFAIFVTAMGLLALAALVPLGKHYAQSAVQYDRGGSCGREAQRLVEVCQMLRWENWVQRRNGNTWISNPTPWRDNNAAPTFDVPYTFLIDPLFHAHNIDNPALERFPHTPASPIAPRMARISLARSPRRADPAQGNIPVLAGVPLPNAGGQRAQYVIPNTPMSLAEASGIFQMRDDMTIYKTGNSSLGRPIIGPVNNNNTPPQADPTNLALVGDDAGTESAGEYSWAAMVKPADAETAYRFPNAIPALRGALAAEQRKLFHVTVIVFHRRDFVMNANSERQIAAANVDFVGDDSITLRAADATGLAANQWIMVSGRRKPPPAGEANPGLPIAGVMDHYWYRITHIARLNPDNVTLRVAGPRWNHTLYQGAAPNTAWVTIAGNVVGVYERTIDLDQRSMGIN